MTDDNRLTFIREGLLGQLKDDINSNPDDINRKYPHHVNIII